MNGVAPKVVGGVMHGWLCSSLGESGVDECSAQTWYIMRTKSDGCAQTAAKQSNDENGSFAGSLWDTLRCENYNRGT
jgi:hypothetical protein